MAFRDENGRITIDEIAAEADIRHIESAKEHLSVALNMLHNMTAQATEFAGKSGTSVAELCVSLAKQTEQLIGACGKTQEKINATINKYEKIDASLKDVINNGGI